MLTLVRQAMVFSPAPLGRKDVLVAGSSIEAIEEPGKIVLQGVSPTVVDALGKIMVPGLVDSHVHILGGGGEGGPATRAPEIRIEDILASGVTTVIGCLGTDGTTRHMESLLAKAMGLEMEGLTTYIFSGSYQVPPATITGSIRSDLVLIDKVVGAGEIAVSDHRSSQPTFEELARIAADCRVGGMLGGKAGILHLHVGVGAERLALLFRLVRDTEIPITQIIPTHVNRSSQLLEEAVAFNLQGGYFDLTGSSDPEVQDDLLMNVGQALRFCIKNKADLSRITISSDSNGSLPVFDDQGKLSKLTIATQRNLLRNFRHILQNRIVELPEAIGFFSTNPARLYQLDRKGAIEPGSDADMLLFDQDFNLTDVLAKGRIMLAGGKLTAQGTFPTR